MTRIVTALNPKTGCEFQAALMLDAGSTETYISTRISSILGLTNGPTKKVNLACFGDEVATKEVKGPVNQIGIKKIDGTHVLIDGITISNFLPTMNCVSLQHQELDDFRTHGLELPYQRMKPDILVGIKDIGRLQLTFLESMASGYYIYQSIIGPFVCGQIDSPVKSITASAVHQKSTQKSYDKEAFELVSKFFASESAGFLDDNALPADEEIVHQQFLDNIRYEQYEDTDPAHPPGRYIVSLPWRDEPSKPAVNFCAAKGRMLSNLKRLRQQPELLKQYHGIIEEQLEQGLGRSAPQ